MSAAHPTEETTMDTTPTDGHEPRVARRSRLRRRLGPVVAIAASGVLLAGCTFAGSSLLSASGAGSGSSGSTTTAAAVTSATLDELASANEDGTVVRDDEWSIDDAVAVTLTGSGAEAASGVTSPDGVVTISEAGVYRISGSLEGRIVVAAPDDAQVVLVLDGATIASGDGPAIEVQTADDVAIHLQEGTESSISDTSAYGDEDDANAAIFSEADLTISGTGSLVVDASNDGITSEDDLAVLGGAISVTAADEALRGKDSIQVEDGALVLEAGGDALQSDSTDEEGRGWIRIQGGTIQATAGDDGLNATTDVLVEDGTLLIDAVGDGIHADVALAIAGGTVTIAGSDEGLESALVQIDGGTIDVTASDDAINGSAGSSATTADAGQGGMGAGGMGGGGMADSGELVAITGGDVTLRAGGDGLDSNGSIEISGGDIVVWGPSSDGNGALDANGGLTVTGGTLLAVGSAGMAESPDDASTQAWLQAQASGSTGSTIEIQDESGATIATYDAEGAFANVVFSAAGLTGSTATVVVDGTATEATLGTATAGGMGMGGGQGGQGGQGGPGGGMPPSRP